MRMGENPYIEMGSVFGTTRRFKSHTAKAFVKQYFYFSMFSSFLLFSFFANGYAHKRDEAVIWAISVIG